jgi:hypothetical protein
VTLLATLANIAQRLQTLDVPYAVGGSLASSAWGRMRATQDADLTVLINAAQLDDLLAGLEWPLFADENDLRESLRSGAEFASGQITNGETLDRIDLFLLPQNEYSETSLRRAHPIRLADDFLCPIISAEDIVIAKLRWYRLGGEVSDRQWNDVVGVLEVQRPHLDLDYLRHWADHFAILDLTEEALSEVERHPRSPESR